MSWWWCEPSSAVSIVDRAHGSIRVTRVGGARWYSSELRPVNPSTPNSSSAYRLPSGARCWVWRVGGMEPRET